MTLTLEQAIDRVRMMKEYFARKQLGYGDCDAVVAAMMQAHAALESAGVSITKGGVMADLYIGGGKVINLPIGKVMAARRKAADDLLAMEARLERAEKVVEAQNTVKPCAVCGRTIVWFYCGDGTHARNLDHGGEIHKCKALAQRDASKGGAG